MCIQRLILWGPFIEYCNLYSNIKEPLTSKMQDPNSQSHSFRRGYELNQQEWVTKSRWAHPLWLAAIINMVLWVSEENHQGWVQNLFQRPSKSQFLPSLALSIPLLSSFYSPSLCSLQRRVEGRGRRGLLDLNLLSSEFRRDDMQPQR